MESDAPFLRSKRNISSPRCMAEASSSAPLRNLTVAPLKEVSVDVQKNWKFTAIRQLVLVTLKKTKRTYHNFPVAKKTLNPTKQGHQRVSNNARIPRNIPEQHTIRDFCPCHPGHSQGHRQAHIYHQKGFRSEPLFCHFHTPVAGELCAELFDHQLARTSSWKLGFRLEKIPMLVNKLNLSEVWLQTTTFTISCKCPKWSQATWATTALLLPEAGLPDPMSHLHRLVWSQKSSAHLKELWGHQNPGIPSKEDNIEARSGLVLLKRWGEDDTPPMLAKPTENLKFTCKCVNAGVLSAWICENQPCERAKSDVTHTLTIGACLFQVKWHFLVLYKMALKMYKL